MALVPNLFQPWKVYMDKDSVISQSHAKQATLYGLLCHFDNVFKPIRHPYFGFNQPDQFFQRLLPTQIAHFGGYGGRYAFPQYLSSVPTDVFLKLNGIGRMVPVVRVVKFVRVFQELIRFNLNIFPAKANGCCRGKILERHFVRTALPSRSYRVRCRENRTGASTKQVPSGSTKARYTFSGDALMTLCNETLLSAITFFFMFFLLVWLFGSPVFYVVTAPPLH